jgi:hypothetical protein
VRRTALFGALLSSACVFPSDEPTGMELSWLFVEVNDADGEEGHRARTCVGSHAEQVAAHIDDADDVERRGTFRFPCDAGFQTANDAAVEASDAFVQLHPGDYETTLLIETPGEADEILSARTVEVLSRAATLELWELSREPVAWRLVITGAEECTQTSLALFFDAPEEALADPPLDEEGEPTPVLYREMLETDRGLGLAGAVSSCADAAGEHLIDQMDRGDYRLEITVDDVTCPFSFGIDPGTITMLDLGALPCG